jgi:hypothetical protein
MFSAPEVAYQNGTNWQIELCRDDGTRLCIIDTVGAFSMTSIVNNVGNFTLTLPQGFNKTLIARDRRILFWRRPASGSMYLEFEGLIRKITTSADEYGNITRIIGGPSLEYLLSGRVVPWTAGQTTATQTMTADNMLKYVAWMNAGTSAEATRQYSSTVFSVQSYTTSGPTVTKTFGYRGALDVMREVCDAARQYGTETYFSIFPTGSVTFEYRTQINQPGSDRTGAGNTIIFGLEYGNLKNPRLIEDWTNEYNYVYALASDQTVTTAADSRGQSSLFALRETTVRGGVADARAKVVASRPALTFTAELLSVPRSIYGLDWRFGDRVTITFDGRQFAALVRSVTISVNETGAETISSLVEAYLT